MRRFTFPPQRHDRSVRVLKIGLSVLIGALAVVMVSVLILIPRATGGAALTVLSGSMTPTIPVGSAVVVRPAVVEDLAVGDVITFQKSSSAVLTTHRIVEVQSDDGDLSFITKGDANEANDVRPVPADAVRARVWFHVPYVGQLRDAVATPWGLGIILALVSVSAAWERITTIVRRRVPTATADTTSEPAPPAPPALPSLATAAPRAPDEQLDSGPAMHPPSAPSPDAGIPTQEGAAAPDPLPVVGVSIELQPAARVEQQFLLAYLDAGVFERGNVLEILGLVRGQVVAFGPRHMVVSVSGTTEHLDGVERLLRPFGLVEAQRSHVVHVGGDPAPDSDAEAVARPAVNLSALAYTPPPPPNLTVALGHANGTPMGRTDQ